ncbi:MAG: transcriptional initiation protein Tat [Cyanobacteria bacterium PR.023]|nr:transcriptional initiation protein Tat [Cyanobacteria bacterium PR.023]
MTNPSSIYNSINKSISRRDFLAGMAALGILGQQQLEAFASQIDPLAGAERSILVIQLNGGNDGINTIIPYGNGAYYDARPKIAIKQADVLHIDDKVGFHPSLTAFQEFYKQGKLAVIQGVGYPEPNRSHFRSIEIWQTAQPEIIGDTGWLGRYLDHLSISQSPGKVVKASIEPDKEKIAMLAVNVDPLLPKSLLARKVAVPSVSDVQAFRFKVDPLYQADRALQLEAFNDIYQNFDDNRPVVKKLRTSGLAANRASERLLDLVKGHKTTVKYPDGKLGSSLKFIAQMVSGGIGAKVYTLGYDGFDTHAGELRTQTNLLAGLGKSLSAFQEDLKQHGCDDKVMVLVFSEFGRRVAENGGGGTDHGTAGPCLVLGGGVKGGLYGQYPSLNELDHGDLKFNVDFRTVYATILDRWLGADSREVLGKNFDNLDFC